MIQAFGLTSNPRKAHPPAVDDVSFEARAGHVTALLGSAGAGKTTALKLMLELQPGRGITYFKGRPLHLIAHPSREVGVLLGDVPGHRARTVRGHLRMLCAAAGVSARRADEVLEVVGLVSLREERLGTLSRGMDRRLGLACALLPDPHTLVLDEPTDGLSVREAQWLHSMLRAHAAQGGTVLFTTADPKEAARIADRVVTLDGGRVVADQEARAFARTRLRPRVAVRSPHAARLAALLTKDARTTRRSVEVVREGGNRLSVYGTTTADVGEIAFRHGILVHQLADEVGDMGPGAGAEGDDGKCSAEPRQSAHDAPADRAASPEGDPAERDPAALDNPRAEPEHAPAGRTRAGGERMAPRVSAAESGPAAFGGSPVDPGRAVDDFPPSPAHARPEVAQEPTTAGSAVAEAHTARRTAESGAMTHGPAAAEARTAALDRSAPDPDTPAPGLPAWNATASERVRGRRDRTPADRSAPESDRSAASLAPAGEAGPGTGLSAPVRVRTADREWSAPGQAVDRGTAPDRPLAHSGAPARDASPAATASPEDGTSHSATAPGEKGRTAGGPGLRPARAVTHRSGDPSTSPDTGPGAVVTASQSQAGSARTPADTVTGTRTLLPGARNPDARQAQAGAARPDGVRLLAAPSPLPPPISVRPARSPLRPFRYEIRRATGIGTGFLTCGAVLVMSALTAVLLARFGHTPQERLFAAWPRELPLPPAALAAGLLGALAFGDEFRHPALAADRGTVPRRLGLLTAKLLVSGATAVLLAFLTVGCDAEVLYVVYGRELAKVPADWLSLTASWFGLVVGCAWAGVLAAGVFRSTTAGLAAVLAVPVLAVPLVHEALRGPAVRMAADFPVRLRAVHLLQWPFGGERYLLAAARVLAQPVGGALALSLAALLCAYLLTALRARLR
ncbi:ABC transporter ATP-binding protein [Streptomyces cyanogenus]|uniref:Fluoroquinolones export ATP-binding protein n=1 Tax=Streptomyces cyanogenus TaxID=80860 RepID=A0ABX7TX60_STRCY|nr:ABC transporter ATP-binding protein [Streptomyces cyanogenus]QTE01373.1 Fluoroquinolones export ATP-binding protein [Streptomyces cyanogenus]